MRLLITQLLLIGTSAVCAQKISLDFNVTKPENVHYLYKKGLLIDSALFVDWDDEDLIDHLKSKGYDITGSGYTNNTSCEDIEYITVLNEKGKFLRFNPNDVEIDGDVGRVEVDESFVKNSKRIRIVLTFACELYGAGADATDIYGVSNSSESFKVEIKSNPDDAVVYMIPKIFWDGKTTDNQDLSKLKEYLKSNYNDRKVSFGNTPTYEYCSEFAYIVVFLFRDKIHFETDYKPRKDLDVNVLSVSF